MTFLKSAFQKLLVNFTWWLNRKDPSGRNVFEGGFLGLDNIGVFDRSAPLPTGGSLEQADGTAWMALYSQNMLEIALELAQHDPMYGEMALKFAEHFLWIAAAMDRIGDNQDELWDEGDGFFYDVLRFPDGSAQRLKVRSMVGLLSLCATTVIEADVRTRFPQLAERLRSFLARHEEVSTTIAPITRAGVGDRRLLAVLSEEKLRRILRYLLDENEFLSPHGIRALSRHHLEHPFTFEWGGTSWSVGYEPAESSLGLFGGNSNWRGPVWMPVNVMILRALGQFYSFYGDDFRVECPTGSGNMLTLFEVGQEIMHRLIATFRARRGWPAAGFRRQRDPAARPALARPHPLLRVLPRRQRRRHRGEPPDRLDGGHRVPHSGPQRGARRAGAGRGPARRPHGRRADGRRRPLSGARARPQASGDVRPSRRDPCPTQPRRLFPTGSAEA